MSHHYVIIDNFPKLVENSKFCLESSVLLIVDTFTNILAYLIKSRHLRIKKRLDWGHWVVHMGTGRPLMTFSIKNDPNFGYLRTKHLKLTKSKCPRCKGRVLSYNHWLVNLVDASFYRLYWNSWSNYWFGDGNFVVKGYLDLILLFRRTNHAVTIKINVPSKQSTWKLIFWRFQFEVPICHLF